MLVNGLDELMGDCNGLQQKIKEIGSQKRSNGSLLSRIDAWQEETIQKVKQAAQDARQQVSKIMNPEQEKITTQLQTLSQEMKQLGETGDVLEQDLSELKQKIGRLHKDLEKLPQLPTVELNTNQSEQITWHRMIYVEDKSVTPAQEQRQSQLRSRHHMIYVEDKSVTPAPEQRQSQLRSKHLNRLQKPLRTN